MKIPPLSVGLHQVYRRDSTGPSPSRNPCELGRRSMYRVRVLFALAILGVVAGDWTGPASLSLGSQSGRLSIRFGSLPTRGEQLHPAS
jgi:hypothetical protein